jgi:hypothetical protein
MSDTDTRATLLQAVNTLDEAVEELLFIGVSIAAAWDDQPAEGCSYLLARVRDTLTEVSGAINATIPRPAPKVPTPGLSPDQVRQGKELMQPLLDYLDKIGTEASAA